MTELTLLLQNWTLSLIFSAGLLAFSNDFDNTFKIYLSGYLLTSMGLMMSRAVIRFGAGWLRNLGYNTRRVAVAGICRWGRNCWRAFVTSRGWVSMWSVFTTIRNWLHYHRLGR